MISRPARAAAGARKYRNDLA